ncbi:MAG TPA: twin-arginine translocase subunit TatB [Gammaproteobacteria bacterium]|nr:twin-arginine translocase subunit TatB [Gammaproteobacteria bacterium]
MFDIGFWELAVIAVVGLIVIGPDKLPGVARTAGKWVGRTRRFLNQVKTDIDREIKQDELRKILEKEIGLKEIKDVLDTDQYRFEEEKDYLVGALDDAKGETASAIEKQPDAQMLDVPMDVPADADNDAEGSTDSPDPDKILKHE